MEIEFSTDLINRLYQGEIVQTRIMLIFCILSLLIAGMGLFALSGLFMQRRTKAAALRKIHGSSMLRIIRPEILYYMWLALLSSFLAAPASYFLLERWMRNFHYRIEMPLWVFPACALLLILFSTLSVLYHSIRLAHINPIHFIREQ
jgi:putative ABC transport system permease protein